jgi:hypothetical protein
MQTELTELSPTVMSLSQPTSITLTRDELLVFLTLLGVPGINGLDSEEIEKLGKHELTSRLNCGEQMLLVRNLIVPIDSGEFEIDDKLAALVGASALPESSLLINRIYPDGHNEAHFFNIGHGLIVEQSSPRVGIHQFEHIPDHVAFSERMKQLFTVYPDFSSSPSASKCLVDSETLHSTIDLARSGHTQEAVSNFVRCGCTIDMATSLVQGLNTQPFWISIAGVNLHSVHPEIAGTVMIITSETELWLLESSVDQEDRVVVHAASGAECQTAIHNLVPKLFQAKQ